MNTIGIICTIIGAIAVILGGVKYIILKAINKGVDKNRLDVIETKVNTLPCEQHKDNINESEMRYNKSSDILMSNNEILVEISKWVMKIDPNMIEQLTRKLSPYRITPIGKIVFETSGAKKSIENHSDFLMSELEKIDPKTAYDVEDSALTVLIQNLGHELFNEVKKYLYDAPEMLDVVDPMSNETVKVRLSMQGILKVMSIHLRDEYLSKHPEIV